MKSIHHFSIVFLCLALIACEGARKAKGPEKLMHEYMLKNVDDPAKYEVVENILMDSTMVDSVTFNRVKNWDGRSALYNLMSGPEDYTSHITSEVEESTADTVKTPAPVDAIKKQELPKNIVAFYTYQHKYRILKKHGKKLKSKLFLYDPRRHKIFDENVYSNLINDFVIRNFQGD